MAVQQKKNKTTVPVKDIRKKPEKKDTSKKDVLYELIFLGILIIITFYAFSPSLRGELTNWDDNGYITDNKIVKNFNSDNLTYLMTHYQMSNYHPIVMVTYSFIYHLFKQNTYPYHLLNLLFHILDCLLLYYFVRKFTGKKIIAIVCTALFAVHPLHVESVSWVSGLKDVMYTFFFLLSLIYYHYYSEKKKKTYYYYSLVLFILSCICKGMAVVLPLILLLMDYFKGRKNEWKVYLEKIPFLLISIAIGLITIFAQKSGNAIGEVTTTSIWQNLLIAAHGIIFYLYKMVLPFHLSAFYPYPPVIDGMLPWKFIVAPFVVVALTLIVFFSKKFNRYIIFGSLFYLLCILQVLQILPVGSAIAADRYFYVSSIGVFIIIGYGFDYVYEKNKQLKYLLVAAFIGIMVFFTNVTLDRTKIWQTSLNLWESVLDEFPTYPGAAVAYSNCGNTYQKMGNYDKAFEYFKVAIQVDSTYSLALKNLGALCGKTGDYKSAMKYLMKAVRYNKTDEGIYNNLGNVYAITGNYAQAIECLTHSIKLNPNDEGSYNNIGNAYLLLKEYDKAISYYQKAMTIAPEYPDAYGNMGGAYLNMNQREKAVEYFKKAAALGSKESQKWLEENYNKKK